MNDSLSEKVKKSLERIKAFEPPEGYYLAFSGGKDSVVCKHLLEMAGVKYDATYRVTSVDPPELVRFIKEQHPDVVREIPRYSLNTKDEKLRGKPITMWNLIPRKWVPPTKMYRYCCAALKESGGDGRMTVTGVRWAEGTNRRLNHGIVTLMRTKAPEEAPEGFKISPKNGGLILVNDNDETRRMVEQCYKRRKTNLNPIIDWTDAEVWEFIKAERIPYCSLYDEGFHRLGCVGCPMGRQKGREADFRRWPKYKDAYLWAFDKMLQRRRERNLKDPTKPIWHAYGRDYDDPTPMDVFNWWMDYGVMPDQISFDDLEEDVDEIES